MQVTTCVLLWMLAIAIQIDARPQEHGPVEVTTDHLNVTKEKSDEASLNLRTTTIPSDVRNEDVRSREASTNEHDYKGLQQMDQSLRTVATQLLNVSSPEPSAGSADGKVNNIGLKLNLLVKKPESNRENVKDKKNSNEMTSEMNRNYQRPGNSKFSYFESSHPGQAMALTEEELERELSRPISSSSLIKKSTTPGGISTWILLNPPSTTVKPLEIKSNHGSKLSSDLKPSWSLTKSTPSTMKIDTTLRTDLKSSLIDKTIFSTIYPDSTTEVYRNNIGLQKGQKISTVSNFLTSTPRLETTKEVKLMTTINNMSTGGNSFDKVENGQKISIKKMVTTSRTISKPTSTTPQPTTFISKAATTVKVIRPNQSNRPFIKSSINKQNNNNYNNINNKTENILKFGLNATSKIEKVTFKPIQTINPSSLEKSPMIVSKIQASLKTTLRDENSTSPITMNIYNSNIAKEGSLDLTPNITQVMGKSKPIKTSVLKVQLRKPVDSPTTIEIEPIQVNAPVLTIEKVGDIENDKVSTDNPLVLGNSKIDVKFDFNPELTKIVETSTPSTSTSTVTTKRPKNTKRKKNKLRRRKPGSGTTPSPVITSSSSTTLPSSSSTVNEPEEAITEVVKVTDSSLQESKIVSDSNTQVASNNDNNNSNNNTKNKKKQIQKPISTQIYNFLSREVMPSVGVMSLVGLGLGLASYFFYPFGGAITRRNYEVEPNYKYNLNEYGGNYGQSEEEVLSKVFQGMNNDGKYGGMQDYEKNYYRYQTTHDGAYSDNSYATRKNIPPVAVVAPAAYHTSAGPVYKPDNKPAFYDTYHRNTDLKLYSDLPTTPPYYERQSKIPYVNNQAAIAADRQFVVGSIPKEYTYEINSNDNDKNYFNNHNVNVNDNESNNQNNDNNNNSGNDDNVNLENLTTSTTVQSSDIQTDFEKQIAQNLRFVKNPVNLPQNFGQTEVSALKGSEAYEEIEITPTAVAIEHGPRSINLDKFDGIHNTEENSNKGMAKVRRRRESVIQQIPTKKEIDRLEHEEDLSNEILDIIDSAISTEFPIMSVQDKKKYGKVGEQGVVDEVNEIENKDNNKVTKLSSDKQTTYGVIKDTEKSEKDSDVIKDDKTDTNTSNVITLSSNTTTTMTTLSSDDNKNVALLDFSQKFPNKESNTTRISITTSKPILQEKFNFFNFVKTLAEIKLRLGLTILKHASENFAKYIGNVQKRLNGDD